MGRKMLIRAISLVLCLLIGSVAFSEVKPKVYEKVLEYPNSFKHAEDLAELIKNDFKTPVDKASAIYCWIALNIDYDVKSLMSNKSMSVSYSYRTLEEKAAIEKGIQDDLVKDVLKKKRAVCEGYSALYKRLCELCGVECVTIKGASKISLTDIGKGPINSNHAWNAIKINGKWNLLDVTWGAGSVDFGARKFNKHFEGGYFMTQPDRFFTKHFPDDKKWLLIDKGEKDFATLPLFHEDYLFSDAQLLQPETGVISKSKNGVVTLKLKTKRSFEHVYYAFRGDRESTLVEVKKQGDILVFEVSVKKRSSGYFTVYADGGGLFSFQYKK